MVGSSKTFDLRAEIVSSWNCALDSIEISALKDEIVSRWYGKGRDPIPASLFCIHGDMNWSQHLELYFLAANKTEENREKLAAAIMNGFDENKDKKGFLLDYLWIEDVNALKRVRNEATAQKRFDQILQGFEKIFGFFPKPEEKQYLALQRLFSVLVNTLILERFENDGAGTVAAEYSTGLRYTRPDDYSVFSDASFVFHTEYAGDPVKVTATEHLSVATQNDERLRKLLVDCYKYMHKFNPGIELYADENRNSGNASLEAIRYGFQRLLDRHFYRVTMLVGAFEESDNTDIGAVKKALQRINQGQYPGLRQIPEIVIAVPEEKGLIVSGENDALACPESGQQAA